MPEDLIPIKSTLSRVELIPHGDKMNVVVTLTGHEMALAADQGRLNLQEYQEKLGFLLVERGKDNKSITIQASATPDDKESSVEKKAANVVEAVYDMTQCRLGGMTLKAEAIPVVTHSANTPYSAAISVEPRLDRTDKDNFVGRYSVEVIRRKHASGRELICDPRADENSLRLLKIEPHFNTQKEALHHGERELNKVENDFGIYYTKPKGLTLAGLHTEPLDKTSRKQTGLFTGFMSGNKNLHVTSARLHGSDDILNQAEEALKRSFPSSVFKQKRHGDTLDVMLCGDNYGDPAKLLATVHTKTRCNLPMDINAAIEPDSYKPSFFNPCLETEVWDDVPAKDRGATGTALAGYVGMQFPDSDILRAENASKEQEYYPARVVVNKSCASEKEAMDAAEDMKQRVVARLRRGDSPQIF